MFPQALLILSALVFSGILTLAIPASTDTNSATSLLRLNLTTSSPVDTTRSRNITEGPLGFLGVDCYHLEPDTVNQQLCQTTFAKMLRRGEAYETQQWWNGWQFRASSRAPCTITLSSPLRDDRRRMIGISIADIIQYAIEVLESCQTGGANTFDGAWRVEVSKDPLPPLPRTVLDSN